MFNSGMAQGNVVTGKRGVRSGGASDNASAMSVGDAQDPAELENEAVTPPRHDKVAAAIQGFSQSLPGHLNSLPGPASKGDRGPPRASPEPAGPLLPGG